MHTRFRRMLGLAAALALHAALLGLRDVGEARVRPQVQWQGRPESAPIEVTLQKAVVAPQVAAVEPEPPQTTSLAPPTPPVVAEPADTPAAVEPPSSSPSPSPSSPVAASSPPPFAVAAPALSGKLIDNAVVGLLAGGPRPSIQGLGASLDFQPPSEQDKALSGGRLAAARAGRQLRRDLAFHDVSMGLGDDWFRGVKTAAARQFRPTPGDLDNPAEVTREAIVANYLRDPSEWDDEARAALEVFLQADRLHSKDPLERLPLGNSANLGQAADSMLRRSTVEDLLSRKDAGLTVRFAFDVDVHHAADGAITAINVLHTEFERTLVEKVRLAVERAVQEAPAVPVRVARGLPFRSRWLFVASWYLDPPRPHFASSNSLFTQDGSPPPLMFGGTFDVTKEGVETSSFDVKHKTNIELLEVTPLR